MFTPTEKYNEETWPSHNSDALIIMKKEIESQERTRSGKSTEDDKL